MKLKFVTTGNFWIDNGLVGLHDAIKERYPEAILTLKANGFEANLSIGQLEELKEEAIKALTTETKNEGWYYDKAKGIFERYRKRNWKRFSQFFLKQIGPSSKEEIDKRDSKFRSLSLQAQAAGLKLYGEKKKYVPLAPLRFDLKISFAMEPGNRVCDFCGQKRLKTVEEASRTQFPFLVGKGKLATFYSHHGVSYKICPLCSLATLYGISQALLYNIGGNIGTFFLPYDPDFRELRYFHRIYLDHLKTEVPPEQEQFRNFITKVRTNYLNETFLALIYDIYTYTVKAAREAERKRIFSKSFYGFRGLESGQKITYESLNEYSRLEATFGFFDKFDENIRKISEGGWDFRGIFRDFQIRLQSGGVDTLCREKLAGRILHFDYLEDIVEDFLFSSGERIPFLDIFVETYIKEVEGMDEKIVKLTRGFGYAIGSKASESKTKSPLYDIRNSKNLDEFLRQLNQIQFAFEIQVPETLIREVSDENWERYKSLVSIFAMNTFLG